MKDLLWGGSETTELEGSVWTDELDWGDVMDWGGDAGKTEQQQQQEGRKRTGRGGSGKIDR